MRLLAWVDGGAKGNPGPAGWGLVLKTPDGVDLRQGWGYLGETTNNVAEYRGLIAALEQALALGADELLVHTDSQLVERQVTGVYKVRQPHLRELIAEVRRLAGRLRRFDIVHVPREENREADRLANRAMKERASGWD